jgi:hypothetical protein
VRVLKSEVLAYKRAMIEAAQVPMERARQLGVQGRVWTGRQSR